MGWGRGWWWGGKHVPFGAELSVSLYSTSLWDSALAAALWSRSWVALRVRVHTHTHART